MYAVHFAFLGDHNRLDHDHGRDLLRRLHRGARHTAPAVASYAGSGAA